MDYEKKYKEALEKIKNLIDKDHNDINVDDVLNIFPELAESEDEKVRKGIIELVRQSSEILEKKNQEQMLAWLEKQGEQKPADKTEAKFKVGDWITDGYVGGQITSIEDNYPCYKIADFMGGINTSIPFTLQDNYHLWTIQDAKDGDVLCLYYNNRKTFFIFKAIIGEGDYADILVHCCYTGKYQYLEPSFNGECRMHQISDGGYCIPADKEEQGILFQKMKEAGYEWDYEKKELKKIDWNPQPGDIFRKKGIIELVRQSSEILEKKNQEQMLAWLEKQGEQKTADKTEPKFHEGDWVILTAGELSTTLQIVNVDTNKKRYWFNDSTYLPIVDEECLHLWTIADAKDGDVLVFDDIIMIFKNIKTVCTANTYVLYCNGIVVDDWCDFGHNAQPATKEQRDILFEEMHKAGYEWDAENKKLKKIEDRSENYKQQVMSEMADLVKDYIRQKSAWSEEDENILGDIIEDVMTLHRGKTLGVIRNKINWLKSIKQRIGG